MSVTNLLVEKLNGVFGSFVTGINAQNLTVDLWNGVIRHEQLKLKPEALAALKLPVTVLSGTVRRLEVRVPWSRLSTEPVVVEIDTVELLAATNYDLGHESLNALEERIRAAIEDKLQRTAEAEVARQESAVLQDTYLSRLGTRIVENMRIKLTNLHARFEDPGRGVGHPLAAGFVLQELSVQTVNADWDSAGGSYMDPSDDPTAARRKLLALTGLEIYWREVAEEELLVEKVVGGGVEIHDAFSQWDQTWFINALDDPGEIPPPPAPPLLLPPLRARSLTLCLADSLTRCLMFRGRSVWRWRRSQQRSPRRPPVVSPTGAAHLRRKVLWHAHCTLVVLRLQQQRRDARRTSRYGRRWRSQPFKRSQSRA